MDLHQKNVVITGVGSGIGRALALALAGTCKGLGISDINEKNLQEVAEACKKSGAKVYASCFDVSEKEAMEAFAKGSYEALGSVDVMINNAGVALGTHTLDELEYEDFEWIFGINLWGMIYGSKAFLPYLTQQKKSALVNVSSVFGLMGVSRQIPYCTTKFAIRGFTESLRMEAITKYPGLNVISVHPGGITTNIVRNSRWKSHVSEEKRNDLTRRFDKVTRSTPEYAAQTIIKGIRKGKNRVLIGNDARLISFITRLLPARYVPLVSRQVRKSTG